MVSRERFTMNILISFISAGISQWVEFFTILGLMEFYE